MMRFFHFNIQFLFILFHWVRYYKFIVHAYISLQNSVRDMADDPSGSACEGKTYINKYLK